MRGMLPPLNAKQGAKTVTYVAVVVSHAETLSLTRRLYALKRLIDSSSTSSLLLYETGIEKTPGSP